jgi:hypothetical protein
MKKLVEKSFHTDHYKLIIHMFFVHNLQLQPYLSVF